MRISDVIRAKGAAVVTIHPDASLATAVKQLRSRHIGALIVSRDGDVVEGIVSERDIVCGLADDPTALAFAVSVVMTRQVLAIAPDETIAHAMAIMTRERRRHLPVAQGGRLVGIVSIGDLVKARLEELELESRVLRDVVLSSH